MHQLSTVVTRGVQQIHPWNIVEAFKEHLIADLAAELAMVLQAEGLQRHGLVEAVSTWSITDTPNVVISLQWLAKPISTTVTTLEETA